MIGRPNKHVARKGDIIVINGDKPYLCIQFIEVSLNEPHTSKKFSWIVIL